MRYVVDDAMLKIGPFVCEYGTEVDVFAGKCACGRHLGDTGLWQAPGSGRLYRLKNGKAPLIIAGTCSWCGRYVCCYTKSGAVTSRYRLDLVPYVGDCNTTETKGTEDMTALYMWKDADGKEVYGHKLAVNGSGLWVMEARDNSLHTVEPKLVEKVMPYTVGVTYFGGASRQQYHFFARKEDFEIGDVVFCPLYDTPVVVDKLDTKAETATVWLTGSVLRPTKVVSYNGKD